MGILAYNPMRLTAETPIILPILCSAFPGADLESPPMQEMDRCFAIYHPIMDISVDYVPPDPNAAPRRFNASNRCLRAQVFGAHLRIEGGERSH